MAVKTLQRAGWIYLLATILAVGIYGCCVREFKITGVQTIDMYHADNALRTLRDTVKGPFSLEAEYKVEQIASVPIDLGLLQTAYAWSCDFSKENEFNEATLRISCDRTFLLDGERVEPQSNFIAHEALESGTYFQYGATCFVYFKQEFLDRAVFEKDFYTFTIYVETSDRLKLEQSIRLFMDL